MNGEKHHMRHYDTFEKAFSQLNRVNAYAISLQFDTEEQMNEDEEGLYAVKKMRDKKATWNDDVPGDGLKTVDRRWF